MSDDDWITLAMADDSLVVDLLLRLHRSHLPTTTTPPPPPRSASAVCLQLGWKVRQRRSRSSASSRHLAAGKKAEPTRASPTTPLSWSCVTSGSCGGGGAVDGYEESSLFYFTKPMETSRSNKVANLSEISMTKRSRRKKQTLVELKEEENLLLKERKNLKNELASLRLTVEKHRATNEKLKRMKLDLESGKAFKAACVAIGEAVSHPSDAVSAASITHKVLNDASSKTQEILNNLESSFLLPDLNLPIEEDLS